MSPRCIKPKCLKRVPIYIPVHRPCLDSFHLPISRPCILPSFKVQSSHIQQNPICHCRDQSCSVKICNPHDWTLSHPHICKSVESINKEDSEIHREQSEQCRRLEGGRLEGRLVQEIIQANGSDKYFEEKSENVNEAEISSQIHLASINNQTNNQRQPLPKMPLNRGQRTSKTSDTIIRNSRDDSRSNVRHVGSTIVPETSCKGIQVSLSSALQETGHFSQNQLNHPQNVSRNEFMSVCANGREPYRDVTYNYDNRRESLIKRDHLNQPNVNSEECYNDRNEALSPCCQSKYIQTNRRDSVDLLNNRTRTSSHNNNIDYPIKDDDKRFIQPPQDTYGSGTWRPSVNSPREHLVRTNRSSTEYTSTQHLMKACDTKVSPNISPVQSQTGFNPVKNQSGRYTVNGKTNCRGRNDCRNMNDLQSNEKDSREMTPLRDIDDDNIHILPNQNQILLRQKPCCKESAPQQNKPVMFPPIKNSEIQKQKLQSKNSQISETLSSGYKQWKDCCNHGKSELVNKFRDNMGPDVAFEHQLGKFTKNLDCACTDKGAGRDMKRTKKTDDSENGTISRASVGCSANQGTKCHCCYPPSFKQFSCAGNINGSCSCDD